MSVHSDARWSILTINAALLASIASRMGLVISVVSASGLEGSTTGSKRPPLELGAAASESILVSFGGEWGEAAGFSKMMKVEPESLPCVNCWGHESACGLPLAFKAMNGVPVV